MTPIIERSTSGWLLHGKKIAEQVFLDLQSKFYRLHSSTKAFGHCEMHQQLTNSLMKFKTDKLS